MDMVSYLMGSASGGSSAPAVLESLSATANGTYTPESGVDGFNAVTVAVPATAQRGGRIKFAGATLAEVLSYANLMYRSHMSHARTLYGELHATVTLADQSMTSALPVFWIANQPGSVIQALVFGGYDSARDMGFSGEFRSLPGSTEEEVVITANLYLLFGGTITDLSAMASTILSNIAITLWWYD